MRGAKPKPTELKVVTGNPGKRPLPAAAPRAPAGLPEPPEGLPQSVLDVWNDVGPLLASMGVLTLADRLALLLLCRAAADFVVYSRAAPPGADVLLSDEGKPYWNMAAAARDKAEGRLLRLLVEFGLTPSARSRVAAAPAAKESGVLSRRRNA